MAVLHVRFGEMNRWLKTLKVGDPVVVKYGSTSQYQIRYVESLTSSHINLKGSDIQYSRVYGFSSRTQRWDERIYLREPTEEMLKK